MHAAPSAVRRPNRESRPRHTVRQPSRKGSADRQLPVRSVSVHDNGDGTVHRSDGTATSRHAAHTQVQEEAAEAPTQRRPGLHIQDGEADTRQEGGR